MATEAQIKAQKKYDAENTRQVHLKLNRRTDEDVLEKLDSVPSKGLHQGADTRRHEKITRCGNPRGFPFFILKRWPFSSFPQFPLRVPYNKGSEKTNR